MFFLDCTRFAHVINLKFTFFLLNLELFSNFRSKFTQKGETIVLYTLEYFWDYQIKGRIKNQPTYNLLHFLRLKIFISKSCSASLVSVRSYIFFMSTYGASEEGDIPFHSK